MIDCIAIVLVTFVIIYLIGDDYKINLSYCGCVTEERRRGRTVIKRDFIKTLECKDCKEKLMKVIENND